MADQIHHPFAEPPAPGAAVAVAPGILWMRLPLPMALDHVNVYALEDGDGWTLVDSGMWSKKTVAIWESLLAGPLAGRPVRRLVVTHHHPDHIGMAGWFQARGVELLIPRTAWLYARMLVLDAQDRPPAESLLFWQRAGLPPEALEKRAVERPFNFSDTVHPLPLGFTRLVEGQVLRIGGRDWLLRMGDGHAPEHATLWADGLVLGGDQILPGISPNIGVFATEPGADPLAEWIASCARLARHARPDQLVLPGHKLPFTGLPFRLAQMEENHHTALNRLAAWLATPRRAVECYPPLFKREIGPAVEGLALVETIAHLNHLLAMGRARRSLSPDGAWIWESIT